MLLYICSSNIIEKRKKNLWEHNFPNVNLNYYKNNIFLIQFFKVTSYKMLNCIIYALKISN